MLQRPREPLGDSTTLRTLHTIVRNCLEHPLDPRFRRLRVDNNRFQREVGTNPSAIAFLHAAGFEHADFGSLLLLKPLAGRAAAVHRLCDAVVALETAAAELQIDEGEPPLVLPAIDMRPSTCCSVGLAEIMGVEDLRRAVLGRLRPVDYWPLRQVGPSGAAWVATQLGETSSVAVGWDLLEQHTIPRRELPPLLAQCTALREISWGAGGGRARPMHADALGKSIGTAIHRTGAALLQSIRISGDAQLSWRGLATLLRTASPLPALRRLEYVAASLPADHYAKQQLGEAECHTQDSELAAAIMQALLPLQSLDCGSDSSCGGQLTELCLAGGGAEGGPGLAGVNIAEGCCALRGFRTLLCRFLLPLVAVTHIGEGFCATICTA